MKRTIAKRIALIMGIVVMLTSLPFFTQEASASPTVRVRYRISYRVSVRNRKNKQVYLSEKKVSLYNKDSKNIKLRNAEAKNVKWSSSNKKIASVKRTKSGCRIKAKKAGTVKIRAKYRGRTYTCKVKVKPKKRIAFTASMGGHDLYDGQTIYLHHYFDDVWFDENGNPHYYNESYFQGNYKIAFSTKLNSIKVIGTISDPSIAEFAGGINSSAFDWDDGDLSEGMAHLNFIAKKAGETYLTITNTYNSQTMRIKLIVVDSKY